jgi:hypothetical protein
LLDVSLSHGERRQRQPTLAESAARLEEKPARWCGVRAGDACTVTAASAASAAAAVVSARFEIIRTFD